MSVNACQDEQAVSVLIPAHNEEGCIGQVIARVEEVMSVSSLQWEVIVVDDGSTDRTAEIARKATSRLRGKGGISLLRHHTNRGYGAALKTGIQHAKYEVIVTTDADGTYPIESIPKLLLMFHRPPFEDFAGTGQGNQYDMVVGARTGEQVVIPLFRRPAKWALTRLAEYVARQPIPDLNSGLRVFSRTVALRLLDLLPDGFSFTTTITLAMLRNGYRVAYSPINYHARTGRSKIRPAWDTLGFIGLIVRIGLYFAPLRVFMPLSGILLFLGLAWGAFSYFAIGQLADASSIIIVMSAFQVGALGMLAELINKRTDNSFRK